MRGCVRSLVVHYHEISLKRGNRPLFLRHLARNIGAPPPISGPCELAPASRGASCSTSTSIPHPSRGSRPRPPGVRRGQRGPRAIASPSTLDAMKDACRRAGRGARRFASFRITARRRLQDVSADERGAEPRARRLRARSACQRARRPAPRRSSRSTWRCCPHEAFVYARPHSRAPAASRWAPSGTVAALLSGGIDSPVAAWRMMKRGCRVVFVHFHSVPYLPATSQAKARALVERLTEWQYDSPLCPGAVRRDPARGRAHGAAARAGRGLPAADGAHRRGDRRGSTARSPWRRARAWVRSRRRRWRTSRASTRPRRCRSCGR